jgi:hypothetical protein
MNIDETLRHALRAERPAEGFRDRVLERVNRTPAQTQTRSRWRVAAAVVLLMTGTIAGVTVHRIERQRQGERAREQVMLALHIAGKKVHYAREEVRDTLKGNSE